MASIGPYHLEETLGSGGMGVVYRAVDPRDGREVAIKTLLSDRRASEASRQRTRRELEALQRLDHPHVLRVLDAGEADGPYMVLELVRGESLADRLRRGPLPLDAALRLAREQASALEHVHAAGLLHRDLKPANVLLREDGSSCLTDFGLTLEVEATRSRLTKTGQLLGTPGFWAPEQAQGDPHACSPATDVYGFGALLYAALTGRPPVEGQTLLEHLESGRFERVRPVRELRPDTPAWLDALCLQCLSPDPARRPPLSELRARLAGGASSDRRPGALAGGLVAILAVVTGATAWALRPRPTDPPPPDPPSAEQTGPVASATPPGSADYAAGLRATEQGEHDDAAQAYRRAAEQGHGPSMVALAQCLLLGRGVRRDDAEARGWIERGAAAGDAEAMRMLGALLVTETDDPAQLKAAREWFRRSAEQGNSAEAWASLGSMLEQGKGGLTDDAEALRCYRLAAEGGHLRSMSRLGFKLLMDPGRSAAEHEAGVAWLRKAAEAGELNAMNNLGVILEDGKFVARDYAEALRWYERAMQGGSVTATGNVGALYAKGLGVERDELRGQRLLAQAAGLGDSFAMRELGTLLMEAQTIPRDLARGLRTLNLAAEKGDTEAMVRLGEAYARGPGGLEKNEALALRWLRAAARGGYPRGMLVLGSFLATQGDATAARSWLQRAATGDDAEVREDAQAELAKLSAQPR